MKGGCTREPTGSFDKSDFSILLLSQNTLLTTLYINSIEMCNECRKQERIQSECMKLSDFIYELKEKLTDEEFKYLLERCQIIHRVSDTNYEMSDEEPEEDQQEVEVYYNVDEENEDVPCCECDPYDKHSYFCLSRGRFKTCELVQFFSEHIPYFTYIKELEDGKIPTFDSFFTLTTTPVHTEYSSDDEHKEKRKLYTACVTFLLAINDLFRDRRFYFITDPACKYMIILILIVYDFMFRHATFFFHPPESSTRLKHTMYSKIEDEMMKPENEDKIIAAQECIPHINIKDTFEGWKRHLSPQPTE